MTIKIIFISIFLSFSFHSSAHEFYFSFAEVQYNTEEERFEISMEVTGHDLEDYLKHKGIMIPRLEDCVGKPLYLNMIEQEISNGFKISIKDKPINMKIVGIKINNNDQVVIFLTSEKIEKPKSIDIEYDLLMDFFQQQQNKLTLFKPEGKLFVTFLNTRTKRTITL